MKFKKKEKKQLLEDRSTKNKVKRGWKYTQRVIIDVLLMPQQTLAYAGGGVRLFVRKNLWFGVSVCTWPPFFFRC